MVEKIVDQEYEFSELSETAKQKAREDYTSGDYPGYNWWDGVYEDANTMAKILGLDIETSRIRMGNKGTYTEINISFSGFCSQGDGASFKGSYRYNPNAVAEMKENCNDVELIRIATELSVMQAVQRLKGCEYFSALIRQSGNYSHSNTMGFDIHDLGIDEVGDVDENQFAQLMRDFADWIYNMLEKQNDWLYSDECVDERLAEEKFDEGGVMI